MPASQQLKKQVCVGLNTEEGTYTLAHLCCLVVTQFKYVPQVTVRQPYSWCPVGDLIQVYARWDRRMDGHKTNALSFPLYMASGDIFMCEAVPQFGPWLVAASAADARFGTCRRHLQSAFAPARYSAR